MATSRDKSRCIWVGNAEYAQMQRYVAKARRNPGEASFEKRIADLEEKIQELEVRVAELETNGDAQNFLKLKNK